MGSTLRAMVWGSAFNLALSVTGKAKGFWAAKVTSIGEAIQLMLSPVTCMIPASMLAAVGCIGSIWLLYCRAAMLPGHVSFGDACMRGDCMVQHLLDG